jgi:sarcosine oxidase, subunit gamma
VIKQSPVAHKFSETEYEFGDINAYQVPLIKREEKGNKAENELVSLCDMSSLNRAGFRGADLVRWLDENHKMNAPEINHAIEVESGHIIARLSHTEIIVMQDILIKEDNNSTFISKLNSGFSIENETDIYCLPRQDSHAHFVLTGESCPELFSKICAVDLSKAKFLNMNVVQTSMARSNVIIIRRDLADIPSYNILIDTSFAEFLWDCLLDAMKEFNGSVVGCTSVLELK